MNILFFGDSISAGSDIPDGTAEHAWPQRFAAVVRGQHTVRNLSRGGRPTDSVGEFAEALALAPNTRLLVLALGTNDSRDLRPETVTLACRNLRLMLRMARQNGIAHLLLIGPCNIAPEKLGATYPIRHERAENIHQLNIAYRELAEREHLLFLSMHGILPETSLAHDGVHPDREGNRILADFFLQSWRTDIEPCL